MAEFGTVKSLTLKADSDLTEKLYHIVRHSGDGATDQASLATAGFAVGAIGVLQNRANSGRSATVGYLGESKVVAGGVVAVGVIITTNASGRATAAVSGDLAVGRAITSAAADGEVLRALLAPVWRLSGAV